MDKRGFHKLFFGVIVLIICVLAAIYWVVTPRTKESLHQLSQQQGKEDANAHQLKPDKNTAIESGKKAKEKQPGSEKTMPPDQLQALTHELIPHKYHPDTYLEARSIIAEHAFCFAVSSDGFSDHMKQRFKTADRLSEYRKMQNQCQLTISAYPVLTAEFEHIYQKLEPQSKLGKQLKQLTEKTGMLADSSDSIYREALLSLLKSKNGPLIGEQASMSFIYLSQGEIVPISQWINSQNNQYFERVFHLALTKLACQYQGGVACQPHSMAMLMLCSQDDGACGTDFNQFYQQRIMPGMKKDIEVVFNHFQSLSE